jgi:hypothetical protein
MDIGSALKSEGSAVKNALLCLTALATLSAAQAQDADLTLPPELRLKQPAPTAAGEPVKPAKTQKSTRAEAKKNIPPPQDSAPPVVASPRTKTEENPLSLGMSWNANNTAEGATRATSGLTETNKNHDGESAGVGAKLGLGYKF